MELDDLLEEVTDRTSFLTFVRALIADREGEMDKDARPSRTTWEAGANGWEHGTIEGYLDAALAWSEESANARYPHGLPEEPSWRAFAEFLYAGKYYE
jgi:hypothetical protein